MLTLCLVVLYAAKGVDDLAAGGDATLATNKYNSGERYQAILSSNRPRSARGDPALAVNEYDSAIQRLTLMLQMNMTGLLSYTQQQST